MNSDLLLKIYLAAKIKKEKYKYPPVRKSHNAHLFG